MTQALLKNDIDGALVDNYVVTHHVKLIQDDPIRVERYIDHQITYGLVLAQNSSRLEKCIRNFLKNNPQEVFEKIAANLVPLRVSNLVILGPLCSGGWMKASPSGEGVAIGGGLTDVSIAGSLL